MKAGQNILPGFFQNIWQIPDSSANNESGIPFEEPKYAAAVGLSAKLSAKPAAEIRKGRKT